VRCKYHLLYSPKRRHRPGPKGPTREIIALVLDLKRHNLRFGCLKIAQTISHAFGIDLDRDTVRRILTEHYYPDPSDTGPSWLSFLAHAKDSLWSVDLFKCESIRLQSFWVFVVLDVFTRHFIGFDVSRDDPDGPTVCRMFNHAIAGKPLPKRLSSDHDPLFRFHRWLANLRILGIDEIKTVPFIPASHPFVERLIGTIRREFLDQIFFWNENDLKRKLEAFKNYYNQCRVHSGIGGIPPNERTHNLKQSMLSLTNYRWMSHCYGLFHTFAAA
jgi:putative transposase